MATPAANPNAYGMGEIPRYVALTSPVASRLGAHAASLPLNLVAMITSYLDDIGDLARLTRTSKLLYYMTLPQLYERVALRSYADIKYVNGRPEGFGSGSPFMMALNGLVTKGHAALVEDFRLYGQYKEIGVEDFAKGRVPDNSMMLNILLRAAMDKMVKLRAFSWELENKPLKTVYSGLASHPTLTSLTLKFPNSRVPRPSVVVPPMPNLRVFKALEIDPLCYPDDISLLLLHSRKLEDLRLHFSPRMRREAEPTLSFQTYFGRCAKANYALPVKHFGLQNFYGANCIPEMMTFDPRTCKSVTFLDTFSSGPGSNASTVYVDETWRNLPDDMTTDFRSCRTSDLAPQHVTIIRKSKGLERMYFVGAKEPSLDDEAADGTSPITPTQTPPADSEVAQLGREYLHALTRCHGSTLKHLLLSDQWAFASDEVGDLVRYCPNLEQLGIAMCTTNHATLRLLMPFLPRLRVLRILYNEWLAEEMRSVMYDERLEGMSHDLWKVGSEQLQWVCLGETVFKIGKNFQATREDGKLEMRREVLPATRQDVQHIEIWAMDCMDIGADPIAPFSP